MNNVKAMTALRSIELIKKSLFILEELSLYKTWNPRIKQTAAITVRVAMYIIGNIFFICYGSLLR